MRASLLGRMLAVAVLLCCSQAAAAGSDGFWARRSDELKEHAHHVRVVLAPGYAKLVVQRTLFNGGERNDEANFDIFLPPGAVAVGLRTLGSLDGRPHWFDGELMEAEEAAAKYLELTGIGGAYPKDPALLSWRSQGHLRLQVFPCPPSAYKSIEYTLWMPTHYTRGAHRLTLPPMGSAAAPPQVVLQSEVPGARIELAGHAYGGRPIEMKGDDPLELALSLPWSPRLTGALASSSAGEQTVNRFRIEAAPQLSRLPRGAKIAVVLDASRSLSGDQLKSSLAMAHSYLSSFDDASVELVTFDRVVRRRYGKLVPVAKAIADLEHLELARGNGSRVDDALALADQLVSGAGGPARIVLFTDALTRADLSAERLRALLGRQALVHIVSPEVGSSKLSRDDEHPWLEVARSTGGVTWSGQDDGGSDGKRVFEELARPTRIHHLAVTLEHDDATLDLPTELLEGEAVSELSIDERAQGWLSLAGELWAEPVRVRFTPDVEETRRWSALIFGQDQHNELSEEQMMVLARRGGAVSPVTSYLAIEPGVRPSTDGLEHFGQGFGRGFGRVRYGATAVRQGVSNFDPRAWLTNELAAAWLRCGGAGMHAEVTLQTTRAEVVEVDRVTSDAGSNDARACLREATWELSLPSGFVSEQASFAVVI